MNAPKLFSKNFTLLVLGQISSLFGNSILRFALSMYILEITGSATIFASILAISMVPTILLSPLGGILADRANRRNIMVALDCLSGIVVLISLVFISANASVAIIAVILIALSILGAFEAPTVQAAVPQMQHESNLIRSNAVVVQVSAISGLIAPILGGVLYASFGLKPIMIITVISFFLTAFLECFIKLPYDKPAKNERMMSIIKSDFVLSLDFICKKQPVILKLLLLAAVMNLFLTGLATVGMPFIIRNVLKLSAQYYGAAESIFCVAAIAGSIATGFLSTKLKMSKMHLAIVSCGLAILPAGIVFLFHPGTIVTYCVIVASLCILQFIACIFSVFCLSAIQQRTPNELLGKTMAYIGTIAICAQPLGQMIYGFLFDSLHSHIYFIIIPTAIIIAIIGLRSKKMFGKLDN